MALNVINGDVTVIFRLQTIFTSYSGPGGSGMLKPNWALRSYTDTTSGSAGSYTTGSDGKGVFAISLPVSSLPVSVCLSGRKRER